MLKSDSFVAEINSDKELMHLVNVGTIQPDTQIRELPDKTWKPASSVPIVMSYWIEHRSSQLAAEDFDAWMRENKERTQVMASDIGTIVSAQAPPPIETQVAYIPELARAQAEAQEKERDPNKTDPKSSIDGVKGKIGGNPTIRATDISDVSEIMVSDGSGDIPIILEGNAEKKENVVPFNVEVKITRDSVSSVDDKLSEGHATKAGESPKKAVEAPMRADDFDRKSEAFKLHDRAQVQLQMLLEQERENKNNDVDVHTVVTKKSKAKQASKKGFAATLVKKSTTPQAARPKKYDPQTDENTQIVSLVGDLHNSRLAEVAWQKCLLENENELARWHRFRLTNLRLCRIFVKNDEMKKFESYDIKAIRWIGLRPENHFVWWAVTALIFASSLVVLLYAHNPIIFAVGILLVLINIVIILRLPTNLLELGVEGKEFKHHIYCRHEDYKKGLYFIKQVEDEAYKQREQV